MERNIKEIVSQMTLEEKAGMCSGRLLELKGSGTSRNSNSKSK